MTMQRLWIEHDPATLEVEEAKYSEHSVVIRAQLVGIVLDEGEVRQLVDWLQGWLNEGKEGTDEKASC